jgi:hypothetical protein
MDWIPFRWAKRGLAGLANPQANCDHRYCYRDIHCTLCGKAYAGEGEPEFTPHIIRDGKPVPAHDENGILVPYGPGSITDAATYDQPLPPDIAERVEPIHKASAEAVQAAKTDLATQAYLGEFARFCAFLDGYDGHPCDGFKAWISARGVPLSTSDTQFFDHIFHKEE